VIAAALTMIAFAVAGAILPGRPAAALCLTTAGAGARPNTP